MNNFTSLLIFETKKFFKPFLIFSTIWMLMIFLFMSFFDSIKQNAQQIIDLYASFPKELLQAVGKDSTSITNIYGYVGSAIMLYLFLSGCILVIFVVSNSLSQEISNHNILFLLSKPISRLKIYTAKFFAIFINIVLSDLLLFLSLVVSIKILTKETEVDYHIFILIFLALFILQFFFMSVAELIGAKLNSGKTTAIVSFLIILSYLFNLISGMSENAGFLKYISPNFYVGLEKISETRELKFENIAIIVLAIGLIIVGGYLFKNKDIE
ncbi:MAG: ABC transporter permease subunit [Candidatus Dojkabacteria bacterium]